MVFGKIVVKISETMKVLGKPSLALINVSLR